MSLLTVIFVKESHFLKRGGGVRGGVRGGWGFGAIKAGI